MHETPTADTTTETPKTGIPLATVVHVADEQQAGPEESLLRVAAAVNQLGAAIRMRVNVQLWDPEQKQYVSWKGQIWKVEVVDAEQARILRDAMEGFFDLVAQRGPKAAGEALGLMTKADQS